MNSIEFYNTPEGDVMVKPVGQTAYVLAEKHRELIAEMLTIIRDRYPQAHEALMKLYSKRSMNRTYFEFSVVSRFIRCNFGEYDQYNHDINQIGQWKFEEVRCPLRGECPLEGVVCRPRLETSLTERELEVFRLIVLNMQAEGIAEELHISPCTVNRHRENIKAKLGLKSIGEMINYWHENNMK